MRAAVLHTTGPIEANPLAIDEVSLPRVGRGQVLIRISACGVCRSSLHMIEGEWVQSGVPGKLPIIPGHEIVGRIESIGEGVDSSLAAEGNRVGVQPLWSTCGTCELCHSSREHLCEEREITGETVDGGFAEFVVANATQMYRIPTNLGDAEAAPLFCPGVTAYGAVKKAELGQGKKVAVFGIGGVGHMVIQFAKLAGAEVIAVGRSEKHLRVAESLGASTILDATNVDPVESIKKIGGVDSSIVFAPSNSVFQQAVTVTKPRGITVMGVWAPLNGISLDGEKRVVSTMIGPRSYMNEVLKIAEAGKIRSIVEERKLEEVNDVLGLLKNGGLESRAVLTI